MSFSFGEILSHMGVSAMMIAGALLTMSLA